jgi:adenine-specific DNA-methyltransferase
MTTVFVGGSRHVSRLPVPIRERLDTIVAKGHRVVVGDANGADKAVQKHLSLAGYRDVTVFCSGDKPRNNVGAWEVHAVTPPRGTKGFQFYAAKDREMAAAADFGLMIWDGESPGTVLNVLRLVQAGKIAVLANVPQDRAINFKSAEQWSAFLDQCSERFRDDLRERATADEWAFARPAPQLGLGLNEVAMAAPVPEVAGLPSGAAEAINAALATGDPGSFVEALGAVARSRGMSQIAREAGLSRESLYRSLGSGGNPEFATVIKIISSLGLHLEVRAG